MFLFLVDGTGNLFTLHYASKNKQKNASWKPSNEMSDVC